MGLKIYSEHDNNYVPIPNINSGAYAYTSDPESYTSHNKDWNPDYVKLIDDLRISIKRGNEEDPIKKMYEASLNMASQQTGDNLDHGQYEYTNLVDENFKKFLDEANKNEKFKQENPNVNLDDYNNLEFGKSAGQEYRDKNITHTEQEDNPFNNFVNGLNQGLNQLNYSLVKPISDAIRSIPDDNFARPILEPIKKGASPDALMAIPSIIEDTALARPLGALGGAAGGAITGGPIGAGVGTAIGSVAGPLAKNYVENKNLFDNASRGIDPITGVELNQDEKDQLNKEATLNMTLGSILGAIGGGAYKPVVKGIGNMITKIPKVGTKLGGTVAKEAAETVAKEAPEEMARSQVFLHPARTIKNAANVAKDAEKGERAAAVGQYLKPRNPAEILKDTKTSAAEKLDKLDNTYFSSDMAKTSGKNLAKGIGKFTGSKITSTGLPIGLNIAVGEVVPRMSAMITPIGYNLVKAGASKLGSKALSKAGIKAPVASTVDKLSTKLPRLSGLNDIYKINQEYTLPSALKGLPDLSKNLKMESNILNNTEGTLNPQNEEGILHNKAFKQKSYYEPNNTKWIAYLMQRNK